VSDDKKTEAPKPAPPPGPPPPKNPGFITLTVTNHHERVIRTAGRYARVSEERRQQFAADYRKLVDNFSLRGAGGRKKTS
jgi:hypothetical protein